MERETSKQPGKKIKKRQKKRERGRLEEVGGRRKGRRVKQLVLLFTFHHFFLLPPFCARPCLFQEIHRERETNKKKRDSNFFIKNGPCQNKKSSGKEREEKIMEFFSFVFF